MKVQQLENLPMVVILNCLAKYFEDGIMPRVLESIKSGEIFEEKSYDWRWIGQGQQPEPRVGPTTFFMIDTRHLRPDEWKHVETVTEVPMAKIIMQEFLDFVMTQADQLSALHVDMED